MIWALLLLFVGLALLWKGADLLSDGAVGLAERMGVSQLIIGLTVVAMGTSAPEIAAGIVASLEGKGDIILGNVYGANIANLSLIGGLVALIRPLQVQATTLKREIPAMLVALLLLWPALRDASLARSDAAMLIILFVLLLTYTFRAVRRSARRERIQELNEVVEPARTLGRDLVLIVLGMAGLAVGARLAVHSAVAIGRWIGMSDAVIGSTILAIGTTLPELMTCTVAAVKGHHDISIGNLVGSVVFNTLVVTGVAALVRPVVVSDRLAAGLDYWIMVAVAVAFTGSAFLGRRTIGRLGGVLLLGAYAGYILYLLASTGVI
jgi:cation:H+ antiporter